MIRPLGYNELYQLARYTLDQYRGTSVICRYEVPSVFMDPKDHVKLRDTFYKAIGYVISQAPTLQAGISGVKTSKPFWIQLGSMDLSDHVEWIVLDESSDRDGFVQKTLAEQLDIRFFELNEKPGWRVVITKRPASNLLDILFVWNHPHCDGMGGKIFHELLLEVLNNPRESILQQDSEKHILKLSDSSKEFPPPIEKVPGLSVDAGFVLKEAWNDYKPPSIFPKVTQANWAPIRSLPYKTRFQSFSIPQSVVSKVVAACREHKTTLSGLLNSIALVSLASRIAAKEASAFASTTAIDQRRFVPTHPKGYEWLDPKRSICNYVSIIEHHFDSTLVSKIRTALGNDGTGAVMSEPVLEAMWSTATHVRNDIIKRLDMGLHNDILGLAKFVPDFRKQFKRDAKKPRKLSWFITNLGVFDEESIENAETSSDTATKWSIRRAQFTLSTEIPVAALLVGIASVKDQELVMTCTWQDTVVAEDLVEGFMIDMKTWLVQIGE